MPYTDLTAAAAASHQSDLIAGAACSRRDARANSTSQGRTRHLGVHPIAAWRSWLEAGRL